GHRVPVCWLLPAQADSKRRIAFGQVSPECRERRSSGRWHAELAVGGPQECVPLVQLPCGGAPDEKSGSRWSGSSDRTSASLKSDPAKPCSVGVPPLA